MHGKAKDALGGDGIPDTTVSAKKSSGLISIWRFRLFQSRLSMYLLLIPLIDSIQRQHSRFWRVLHNRRCMVQGYHGTGKSTHIEQVAARLNWPCIRINLDSHVSRMDLVGKDAIVLKDGQQITEFKEGLLPGRCSAPVRSSLMNMTRGALM